MEDLERIHWDKQVKDLRRRKQRALEGLTEKGIMPVVQEWTFSANIDNDAGYLGWFERITRLRQENAEFRADVDDVSSRQLNRENNNVPHFQEAVDEAVKYMISELAFCVASPAMLNAERVLVTYYKQWPVMEKLLRGHYAGIMPVMNVGFHCVTVAPAAAA